jgi:23S rRNA pseudouridine955/2504/2580 synthase
MQPLSTRLAAGDEVRLFLPESAAVTGKAAPVALRVCFEDENLLAADKPAGLPSVADRDADSLLLRARRYLGQPETAPDGDAAGLASLCHRLDTGTSGVLLLAKNAPALQFVTGLMRQRQLQKTYYGVTVGRPTPPCGALEGWLWKDARKSLVRILPAFAPGAKPVSMEYETLALSGRLALLRIKPHTGHTHQIRAQLAAAGTPLLGDSKYGGTAENRTLRCRYQCLCAAQLAFPEISGGAYAAYSRLSITCPKPWYYRQVEEGTLTLAGV